MSETTLGIAIISIAMGIWLLGLIFSTGNVSAAIDELSEMEREEERQRKNIQRMHNWSEERKKKLEPPKDLG